MKDNLGLPFGLNTLTHSYWVTYPALKALEPVCRDNGVGMVEIPFPATSQMKDPVRSVLDFKRAAGIQAASVCHYFLSGGPNPLDPGEEGAALEMLKSACEFARAIGADRVVGPLGWVVGGTGTRDGVVAFLKKALVETQATGVTLCLEFLRSAECGFMPEAEDDAIAVVREIGDPRLKILVDTFHVDTYLRGQTDTLAKVGELLGHVHISGRKRMAPGLDVISWLAVAEGLRRAKYNGPVVLELFGDECRREIPGIADPTFPRSLSTAASVEVARFTLEQAGIIAPLASQTV